MAATGARGSRSFENDAAMDWGAWVQSVEDVRKLIGQLERDTAFAGMTN